MTQKNFIQKIIFVNNSNDNNYYMDNCLLKKIYELANQTLPYIISEAFNIDIDDVIVNEECYVFTESREGFTNIEMKTTTSSFNHYPDHTYFVEFNYKIKGCLSFYYPEVFCLNSKLDIQHKIESLKDLGRTILMLRDYENLQKER